MTKLTRNNTSFLTESLQTIVTVRNEWANALDMDTILRGLGQIAKEKFDLSSCAVFTMNNQSVDQLLYADEFGRTLQAYTQQLTEHMSRQERSGQYGNALWLGSKDCEWIIITPVQSSQKQFAVLVTTTDPHGKTPSLKQELLTILCSLAGELVAVKQIEQAYDALHEELHMQVQNRTADLMELHDLFTQSLTELEQTREYPDYTQTVWKQRVREHTVQVLMANAHLKQELIERENAEAVERQQRVLAETLRDITADLYSTLDINVVLDSIISNLERIVPHDTSNIMLIEDDVVRVVRCHGYQDRATEEALLALRFPVEVLRTPGSGIDFSQPISVSDKSNSPRHDNLTPADQMRSYTGVPISIEEEIVGCINLESATPRYFTWEHTKLLSAFAHHAAIAIQNAQVYERTLMLARKDERHRIANELHNSVTQTLWSATLVADVLPNVWVKNNAQGLHTLARLRQLTRGALSEMRNLLLELRPDTLTQITLEDGLRSLVDATAIRTGIEIVSIFEGYCSLQPDTQLMLYRIAQEALNNASRHARADRIVVELHVEADQLMLTIRDNGRGFNQSDFSSGHMGLAIMRERARSIHSTLNISSESGRGTQVVVICPL